MLWFVSLPEPDRLLRPGLGQVLRHPTQHLHRHAPPGPAGLAGQAQGIHSTEPSLSIKKKTQELILAETNGSLPLLLFSGRHLPASVLPGARGDGGDGAAAARGPAGLLHLQLVPWQRHLQTAAPGPHPGYLPLYPFIAESFSQYSRLHLSVFGLVCQFLDTCGRCS